MHACMHAASSLERIPPKQGRALHYSVARRMPACRFRVVHGQLSAHALRGPGGRAVAALLVCSSGQTSAHFWQGTRARAACEPACLGCGVPELGPTGQCPEQPGQSICTKLRDVQKVQLHILRNTLRNTHISLFRLQPHTCRASHAATSASQARQSVV